MRILARLSNFNTNVLSKRTIQYISKRMCSSRLSGKRLSFIDIYKGSIVVAGSTGFAGGLYLSNKMTKKDDDLLDVIDKTFYIPLIGASICAMTVAVPPFGVALALNLNNYYENKEKSEG